MSEEYEVGDVVKMRYRGENTSETPWVELIEKLKDGYWLVELRNDSIFGAGEYGTKIVARDPGPSTCLEFSRAVQE